VTVLLPSFHARIGQLLHERAKVTVALRPEHEVPVFGNKQQAQTRIGRVRSVSSITFSNAK
jgi:hypothetical protein